MQYSRGYVSSPSHTSAIAMRTFTCGYEDVAGLSTPCNSVLWEIAKKVYTKKVCGVDTKIAQHA